MNLKKFLMVTLFATVLSLFYIQMQVQIYGLAYDGKAREKEIFTLVDDNGHVSYNIAKLKSANHLGLSLLVEDGDIDFAGSEDIVQIEAPAPVAEDQLASRHPRFGPFQRVASLFALKSVAEAKPIR